MNNDGKRLGLSESALDVAWRSLLKIYLSRGGGPGEGLVPGWRRWVADDGKRFNEVRVRWELCSCGVSKKISLERGGVWGGEGELLGPIGGWRMTGSA